MTHKFSDHTPLSLFPMLLGCPSPVCRHAQWGRLQRGSLSPASPHPTSPTSHASLPLDRHMAQGPLTAAVQVWHSMACLLS